MPSDSCIFANQNCSESLFKYFLLNLSKISYNLKILDFQFTALLLTYLLFVSETYFYTKLITKACGW